jgi:hypothetical protein
MIALFEAQFIDDHGANESCCPAMFLCGYVRRIGKHYTTVDKRDQPAATEEDCSMH